MLHIAYPRSSEGPSPETCRRRSGEWRPAAAARNQGPGRSGTPPARHYDLAARSSLHGSGRNAGEGSAAPDRKSPRWSAERRARPAGRAPRLNSADRRARQRDNRNTAPFGAPLAPHGADGKEESKTRAQQRAAGMKKIALFEIVNRNYAATRLGPRQARASARLATTLSCPGRAKRDPGPSAKTPSAYSGRARERPRPAGAGRPSARAGEVGVRGWTTA
jgi:hypothetical protein